MYVEVSRGNTPRQNFCVSRRSNAQADILTVRVQRRAVQLPCEQSFCEGWELVDVHPCCIHLLWVPASEEYDRGDRCGVSSTENICVHRTDFRNKSIATGTDHGIHLDGSFSAAVAVFCAAACLVSANFGASTPSCCLGASWPVFALVLSLAICNLPDFDADAKRLALFNEFLYIFAVNVENRK
jgi:hypothetical protein